MKYETFSIRFEPSLSGGYTLFVDSPQGEGRGAVQIPISGVPLEPLLLSEEGALESGKALFRALFRDETAHLFHASVGRLGRGHTGLRVSILLDARHPETARLQGLPWELLCRPETEDFLCLSRRTPVVRSLEAHRERCRPLALPRRIRILVVAASPVEYPFLDLARERTNLEEAWRDRNERVEIVFVDRGGVEEMRRALLDGAFHVLHFMGHGVFDGEGSQGWLLFERTDGTSHALEARKLAHLLRDFDTLRLVVLNACGTASAVGRSGGSPFTGVATALVMSGVPAVVAMNGFISDPAALAFSRSLYRRLAEGDPIEAAVAEGRLAIQRSDSLAVEWATPALFLRSKDGQLFAPRSRVWARRVALLMTLVAALAMIWILLSVWLRERRKIEGMRLVNEGVGLLAIGRTEEALQALRAALDLDPNDAAVVGNLSIVEMQLGLCETAVVHARKAVTLAPRESVHHYNLGGLLALGKRFEEALSSLRRAIEIDPNYVSAYNELGNVYLELNRTSEARQAFTAALSRDPTQGRVRKNLGRVELSEGHPKAAIRHLESALRLYPPSDSAGKAEGTYWLAIALENTRRDRQLCVALRDFAVFDSRHVSPFAKGAALLAARHGCAP